ncbi:peptidoglycan DD-metalloendopeptidase family protein [Nocardioides aequoreus]|uniref:peptidoglycan DD-metalloendopeptidase family protein n=1 Tax=Nocardioides aequoreus TaxID=397278 RepID=UPI00068C4274|nr:M23 family metallopeptidase [Nocardioides aequoreus]
MRPRSRTSRSLAAAATLALTCALVAPAAGADDLRDRDKRAKSQVRDAQGALQESSRRVSKAQARLAAAREQLAGAQQRLGEARGALGRAQAHDAAMAERLVEAEAELEQARTELERAKAKVRSQRGDIGRLAASMYANGDPQLVGLSIMLDSQDPAEATTQLNTANALMDRHTVVLAELSEARAEMVRQERRVETATERVADERAAAAERLATTATLEAEATEVATEVRTLVGERRSARASAVRIKAADRRALAAAEAQAAAIRKLILERAAKQRGGFRGDSGGFLGRPVPGGITSPYGYRTHPIYGYWGLHDGTDFRAPCGTANVAVGAGTVISQQWSDVYGNRLYLDVGQVNGKNLTVVYNHLSGYAVSSGARVSRGQTLGYSGNTGWSTACHLHFSVLENGSPVDPMKYL